MDINRKAHPDCKYSGNPFHECGSDCLEKIAQGRGKKASKTFGIPGSFGKKKNGSQPQSPINTRSYQNGTANSRVYQSRPSPVVVKKKMVPEPNKSSTSDEISITLNGQDDSFNNKHEKPLETFPLSPNNMANYTKTVSPKPREHEHSNKNDTAREISVFNAVSPPRSYANDDDDDENNNYENGIELDLESVMSESCVSVGKYRVNSSVSAILHSIIEKHGDIAENCKLESASMRSRYLECLCTLMQELGSTPVGQLTKSKVKEMLAVLKDLEAVNIDIGWLRSVLEEFGQFQENEDSEKERQEELVRLRRQEVESQETDLAKMEEEMVKMRLKVEEMKAEVAEMEKERLRREEMGFKVEKFKGKTFLDELL